MIQIIRLTHPEEKELLKLTKNKLVECEKENKTIISVSIYKDSHYNAAIVLQFTPTDTIVSNCD